MSDENHEGCQNMLKRIRHETLFWRVKEGVGEEGVGWGRGRFMQRLGWWVDFSSLLMM